MKWLLKALTAVVFFLLISPSEAVADPVFMWKVTVTNNTGMVVSGVHLVFTGTGGSIHDAMMTMNAPGAGPPTINGMSNMIDISWGDPGLPPGGTFMFQFSTNHPEISFSSGNWVKTPPLPVDPTRDSVKVNEIPEPTTMLLLGTGLAGVAIKMRKRFKHCKHRQGSQ